ncbi:MAG TPA: glycosyl transferase [Cyanobacteria bacterium UBA8803]|nr:glycosyl transferase [Cyanobacteria bacterium UBA9273]HBL58211.1 glycosyl transferase [Cyanobacteria bacterium UBA8803]
MLSGLAIALLLIQIPATCLLLSRLSKGPGRRLPVEPQTITSPGLGTVSVVVPTLNERERLTPCLVGLTHQSNEVREIIVVDSRSTDGTPELVKNAQEQDPRFKLITDDPLPPGWIGRPWALHNGYLQSSPESKWILGIDADTQPMPGLVAGLIQTAEKEEFDLVSLSPQFILKYPGEWWLQPALLITLVYRFGPTGIESQTAERVMANGQCFLCRRDVLTKLDGYKSAKGSFCDDVTLARYAAACGFKVGFLDGAKVLKVRMYEGAWQTWNEWGRSLDLKDASSQGQLWSDLWLLLSTQGLPLPTALIFLTCWGWGISSPFITAVAGLNLLLLSIRFALVLAIAPSYDRTQSSPTASWLFWLSPLADPLAVLRIFLSAIQRPTQWRGRTY